MDTSWRQEVFVIFIDWYLVPVFLRQGIPVIVHKGREEMNQNREIGKLCTSSLFGKFLMMCTVSCTDLARFFQICISCEILVARPAAKFVLVCKVGLLLIRRYFENTCNMLSFQLDATKRAIEFAGKKNSNFFELFSAKLIWFCHCHREQGNTGLTRKILH